MNKEEDRAADRRIREAAGRGDPVTLDLVWRAYGARLLALLQAMLYSRHDAEDVLQEVFVKLARHHRKLAGARRVYAYLCATARNEARTFIARASRRSHVPPAVEDWVLTTAPVAGAEPPAADRADRLRRALASVPAEQRGVILLKLNGEMTFKDIARALGVSANTAASRYRYGIERLRRLLAEDRR